MNTNIVVLGGGTGTFTVLTGLKQHPGVLLSAIVTVADNGGSSGRLRIEHGVLPPGDILQALVALSESGDELRRLFVHRFNGGRSMGDTLGNLVLTAAQMEFGDVLTATRQIQKLLRVRGQVIPVSQHASQLHAVLRDGTELEGEDRIDCAPSPRSPIASCSLRPPIEACAEALSAIRKADVLVFGPGDLYTSTIPVMLVKKMREAVARSEAERVYVMNLMTKRGQTDSYQAGNFLEEAERYIGSPFHVVLVNNAPIPPQVVARYAEIEEHAIKDDLPLDDARIIRADLLSLLLRDPVAADALQRSLIRHDPEKLAAAILSAVR